jgi:tetratricopeptide (TPR) repeat protein
MKGLRRNTLVALVQIYSEDPYKNYDQALAYAQDLVADNPDSAQNLFAIANLYEKFGKVSLAEDAYTKAFNLNPQDEKACSAKAAFLNKPLWDGQARFEEAVATLETCAGLTPNDPAGYYKVATYYWDKAFRDPMLNDAQKDAYADKGMAAVDKALDIDPDYCDALIYKGLLLRVKAQVAQSGRDRAQFLDQADAVRKMALECKKNTQAPAAPAS